jgi:MFS family permease
LLEKTALLPSLVTFFLCLVNGATLFFIALYAAGLGVRNIGLFFAANALCMAISRPLSGRWADRGSASIILLVGLLLMAGGIAFIALSHSITTFILAGVVSGFGTGFCIPPLQAASVRCAPVHRRGAATGTYFMAFDMGLGLGAILWGFVTAAFGYRIMYFTALIPLAIAGAIFFKFKGRMSLGAG